MRFGYAGMARGVVHTKFKHCTQKYATKEKLEEIIQSNFDALYHLLTYNVEHHIQMFRLSSDFIPFASHPLNTLDWQNQYQEEFDKIHDIVIAKGLRLSMHPGQYVVLNSLSIDVVERSILELQAHADLLEAFKLDATHKMVLHIGGVYQDKEKAIERFISVVKRCSSTIHKHLVIENDDRYFNIEDILYISRMSNIPVVFDLLHHRLNPASIFKSDNEWISECLKTWKEQDGVMKVHYSQQAIGKRAGAHSDTINLLQFHHEFKSIKDLPIDLMLEVKDKNLSVNKVITYLSQNRTKLLNEWSKYHWLIYERSKRTSLFIENELKVREFPIFSFYQYIDDALKKETCYQEEAAILKWNEVPLNKEMNIKRINQFKKSLLEELLKQKEYEFVDYYLTLST